MSSTGVRVLRAGVSGCLIAVGIGVGAFNPWWVALAIGVPAVFVGMALMPRPSRISELSEFRRGTSNRAVPIEVNAITRSSLTASDLQPTMLTATLRPPDDTAYDARWITAMSRGHFQSLVERPFGTVPPDALPPRETSEVPEFGDQPGRRALLYPAVTIATAGAVLFGVPGTVWDVDLSMPSMTGGVADTPTSDRIVKDLTGRLQDVLGQISELGSSASDNILGISLGADQTSRAEVYDPTTGQSVNLWKYGDRGWQEPQRTETTKRRPDTFRAAEIATTDISAMASTMQSRVAAEGEDLAPAGFTVGRPVRGQPVLLVGGFGEHGITDVEIQGRADGTVAAFFDPGDFDASFGLARAALTDAGLSTDQKILRRFEIRGTANNTPTMYAGQIQNSGGVLMEFSDDRRYGTLTVVPGAFPEFSTYAGTGGAGSFSFEDVSPEVFASVRRDAMARGVVERFDADAVDIQMSSIFQPDGQPVIQVELARESASAGTYSPDGRFLEEGY